MAGLNQKQLTQILNCPDIGVSFWIRWKRMSNIIELQKIAEITNRSMEWFFKEVV